MFHRDPPNPDLLTNSEILRCTKKHLIYKLIYLLIFLQKLSMGVGDLFTTCIWQHQIARDSLSLHLR